MSIGFDDGEPILVGDNNPDVEFEAFETQMVSTRSRDAVPAAVEPRRRSGSSGRTGCSSSATSAARAASCCSGRTSTRRSTSRRVGFLARAGRAGRRLHRQLLRRSSTTSSSTGTRRRRVATSTDDPDECVIPGELRGPLLGLDEDEGANFLSNGGRSTLSLAAAQPAAALQPRLHVQRQLHARRSRWTPSRTRASIRSSTTRSRPELNWALSDFDRRHRLILSWTWELPFTGNAWADGWQLSGVGTFQSGRPFTITDEDFSGFLFASQNPRPSLAAGMTLDDQTTSGSVSIARRRVPQPRRLRQHRTRSSARCGRNSVTGPGQQRLDINVSKMTKITSRSSLELRLEVYNLFNTTSFRNPQNDLGSSDFGVITATRGGPRLVQLGAKVRF